MKRKLSQNQLFKRHYMTHPLQKHGHVDIVEVVLGMSPSQRLIYGILDVTRGPSNIVKGHQAVIIRFRDGTRLATDVEPAPETTEPDHPTAA